jgi:hypothetical protein
MGRDRKKEWEQLSDAEKRSIEERFREGQAQLQEATRRMQGAAELQQTAIGQAFKQSMVGVNQALQAVHEQGVATVSRAGRSVYEQSMTDLGQAGQHVTEQIKVMVRHFWRDVHEQIKAVSTKLGALLANQIDGFLLFEAVADGDDEEAQRILASENFGLPVIKFMLHYASLGATERLNEQRKISSELDAAIKAIQRKNEARTQAARETRKENSLIPDIEARLQAEEKNSNLGARDLAGKLAKEFNVSPAYVREIRRNFFANRSRKSAIPVK